MIEYYIYIYNITNSVFPNYCGHKIKNDSNNILYLLRNRTFKMYLNIFY